MKNASFLIPLLAAIILFSCEYQPSEVYNRTVNRDVTPPLIQAVELNIDADTLYLYNSMEIKFQFQSDNQEINLVNFSIDGIDLGSENSGSGTFQLQTGQLAVGIHDLVIEVYTGSGTGSLADELGVEGFVASESWKLVMMDYYFPEISKTVENGLLKIKWKEYRASNFMEYAISRSGPHLNDTEIKRVKTNEFIDSTYVGELAQYYVQAITRENIPFSGDGLYLDPDLPQIFYSVEDSNKYLVRWSKSKYYNAIDTFAVYQDIEYDFNSDNRVMATRDLNDTVYQVTGGCFGDMQYFKLRLVPRKTNAGYFPESYYWFQSTTWGFLGLSFRYPEGWPYCFPVKNDEFVYYDCNAVKRYSISQRRDVETLTYEPTGCSTCNFVITQSSNTGKYLTSYVDCDRDILFTSGTELDNYSIHSLQNITLGSHPAIAVSDTGTAIIQHYDGGFSLYDLSASAPLGYYPKNYFGDYAQALKISPSGEYFFVSADTLRMVRFRNGQFTDAFKLAYPNNIKFYEFDAVHPDRVIFWDGSTLSVNLCSDMSIVREVELKDDALLDIDYYNDEMLTYTDGHLLVRSFSNGSLIKDVPVHFNPTNWTEACYLVNHTIVYGKGLLYFIYPD